MKAGQPGIVAMVGVGILACSSKTALLKTDDGAIAPTVGTGGAREGTGGARGLGGAGTGGSSSWEPDAGPSQDPVLQACLLAASCGAPGTSLSPSACIAEFGKTASRWDDTMLNHLLSCAGATSCSELRSCWGGDLMTLSTVVYNGECIGNVISVELIAGVTPAQFDCGAIGGECAPMASGSIQAGCNLERCCNADPITTCNGAVASGCGGWCEYASIDCGRTGRQCEVQDGRAICVGTGPACDESTRVTCWSSVATYCAGGSLATIDCATTKYATACAEGATSLEPCTIRGKDCDPTSFVGQCDGSMVQLCVDGSIASFDCQSIGFPRCDLPSVGAAHCIER